jgi:hypothetical protein
VNEFESNFNYDFRQLSLMEEQLSQFESNKIKLPHLISGLKSLRDCLRTIDEDWKKKFTGEWWTLEQVYAVAIDRKKTNLSSEDLTLVKEAIGNLRILVASAKDRSQGSSNRPTNV